MRYRRYSLLPMHEDSRQCKYLWLQCAVSSAANRRGTRQYPLLPTGDPLLPTGGIHVGSPLLPTGGVRVSSTANGRDTCLGPLLPMCERVFCCHSEKGILYCQISAAKMRQVPLLPIYERHIRVLCCQCLGHTSAIIYPHPLPILDVRPCLSCPGITHTTRISAANILPTCPWSLMPIGNTHMCPPIPCLYYQSRGRILCYRNRGYTSTIPLISLLHI